MRVNNHCRSGSTGGQRKHPDAHIHGHSTTTTHKRLPRERTATGKRNTASHPTVNSSRHNRQLRRGVKAEGATAETSIAGLAKTGGREAAWTSPRGCRVCARGCRVCAALSRRPSCLVNALSSISRTFACSNAQSRRRASIVCCGEVRALGPRAGAPLATAAQGSLGAQGERDWARL